MDIRSVAREVNNVWKIIKANIGIDEYLRQGCRLYYLRATTSTEEAERLIDKAEINFEIPKRLIDSGFGRKNIHLTSIVTRGPYEYRIQLMSVTRYEATNPDVLIKADPRFLSNKQREIRIEKLKRMSEYSSNPMYAACLDVDCYQALPEKVSVEEFIIEQEDVVKSQFVPMLERT